MNRAIVEVLTTLGRDGEHVFAYRGRGMTWIDSSFRSACKAAEIKDCRFHDLRHTWASHAVMKGVDIRTIQQVLGHSTLAMTQRYSHLSPEHAMKAVDSVVLGEVGETVEEPVAPFKQRLAARR